IFFISTKCYSIEVYDTRCENQLLPLGVNTKTPSFSWKLTSAERGIWQQAYRIIVADNKADIDNNKGNIWDSGKCISGQSLNIIYGGDELQPALKYYWKVQVWDNKDNISLWSDASFFRMGLLTKKDWLLAKWIALDTIDPGNRILPGSPHPDKELDKEPVMPQFRRSFQLNKKVAEATLFITGLGHFELSLNGQKVGDHFLDPGWSNYEKTAWYVTFDMTDRLQTGENVLRVRLGNGFFHIPRNRDRYHKLLTSYAFPKMLCKLQITYEDGTIENIVSDSQWKVTASLVTFSSIYEAKTIMRCWKKPDGIMRRLTTGIGHIL
ncbi:MAG: alpha-L-rhamnosidase N-terminal domain-containing protein, partial [Tannerellaceae bacterium]|nr:alpha-L-rhamnosidase N-terminal domain-containing protein [Tannerellaceae bacterium]